MQVRPQFVRKWVVLDMDAPFGSSPDYVRVEQQLWEDLPLLFTPDSPQDFRWMDLANYNADTGTRHRVLVVLPSPTELPIPGERAHLVLPSQLSTLAPCQELALKHEHFLFAAVLDNQLLVWIYWHGTPAHFFVEDLPEISQLTERLQNYRDFCSQDNCLKFIQEWPCFWSAQQNLPCPNFWEPVRSVEPLSDMLQVASLSWLRCMDLLPPHRQGRLSTQKNYAIWIFLVLLWVFLSLIPGSLLLLKSNSTHQRIEQMQSEILDRHNELSTQDSLQNQIDKRLDSLEHLAPLLGPSQNLTQTLTRIGEILPPGARIEKYLWVLQPPQAKLRFDAVLPDWSYADALEKSLDEAGFWQVLVSARRQVASGQIFLLLEVEP